ncbi:MAG: hypothetical protein ABII09_05995 [Planctomycetota bacterium]
MTQKILLVTVAIISFLVFSAFAVAVDTRDIEAVRAKKVLDNADLETIDKFVSHAVSEILTAEDFSSISNVRSIILANSGSNEPGQAQYEQQFSESAQKHISNALQQAEGLTPSSRRFRVITNLLMLLDDLANPRLIDLPFKYVDSNNAVISYWAVHCLTNPKVTSKLELDTVRRVAGRLESIVETSSPEVLRFIASFAGSVNIPEGDDLLLKVADRRIASYADWSVRCELVDADILKLLADKMASSGPGRAAAGRRFGQLLSYVFQRYIKGAEVLKQSQKEQLVSVLVETERTCLPKLTGKPSFGIKRAIESGDFTVLLEEHNNLLGDSTKQGQLPAQINFDYGKDSGGAASTQPLQLTLPQPTPETKPDSAS